MHHCKRIFGKHAAKAANVEMNQHVFALDLFHVWAQLAPYVSFESLIVLPGDAVITATSKQPVLAKVVWLRIYRSGEVRGAFNRFRGRRPAFELASIHLVLIAQRIRRTTLSGGAWDSTAGCELCGAGRGFCIWSSLTLDLAWPEFKVAVEYDGDHHRTSKTQWRRDQEKRGMLVGRRWLVFIGHGGKYR